MSVKPNASPDALILSCRLKSGKFEGSVEIPLWVSENERSELVRAWVQLMDAGVKCGQQNRERE